MKQVQKPVRETEAGASPVLPNATSPFSHWLADSASDLQTNRACLVDWLVAWGRMNHDHQISSVEFLTPYSYWVHPWYS